MNINAVAKKLKNIKTRDQAKELLKKLLKNDLIKVATHLEVNFKQNWRKQEIALSIENATVGSRLRSEVFQSKIDIDTKRCPVCKKKKINSEFENDIGIKIIKNQICNCCLGKINNEPIDADRLISGIAQILFK